MEEIWKDIEGYEGLYQISNLGRVKSFHYSKDGKIMKCRFNDGYLVINLYKDKEIKTFSVHRLVALAFIPNDDIVTKTEVGHKDETRDNNCATNLEWVSPKENSNTCLRKERLSKVMKLRRGSIAEEEYSYISDPSRLNRKRIKH